MGNCLDLQKPVTWVEDEEEGYWEWESMEISTSHQQQKKKKKKESSSTAEGPATEIKIKLSKKQLEELLRQVDSERVPLRRVLFDFASGGAESSWEEEQQQQQLFHHHEQEIRHWKPELQSIPEVPECDNRNY